MISKELLKAEIDNIKDEYLVILYRIIKALETPIEEPSNQVVSEKATNRDKKSEWHKFIQETYGSLADAKIKRGDQGVYEVREAIE
jgi:hypothetical protein